jgi:ABC-type uncharacterized transport system auxiliary subunit
VNKLWMWLPALALTLAACGSLFQTKAAPPTMYLLSMTKKAVDGAGPLPVDLGVLKPRVRAGLDTDRIAVLYPDRRLDYFANVRWSGPVDELVQELAIQEFRGTDAVRNVSADASVFGSTYWLEVEVADFQAEYATAAGVPNIHVHLVGRLGSSTDRRVMTRFEADAIEPAADNRMGAIAEAFNRAADKALSAIVADSVETLKAR